MMHDRILNINDNETSRFALTRMLQHAGFEVIEAETGQLGLELSKSNAPDVILLDIKLPDINGFEVCRRLKSDPVTHSIPLLHVTAHALATNDKVQSLEEGADAYLSFPVERSYLVAMVRSLVRMGRAEKERKAYLENLDEKNRELLNTLRELEAEKAMKEKFVATLSHDLRNPLAMIRATSQIVKRKLDQTDFVRSQLDKIIHTTDRADHMIQDLLDTSLLRVGQKLPVKTLEADFKEVIEEVIQEFTSRFGKRFVLISPEHIQGKWDPRAIRRMVENLLQNAIKYGSQDQNVTISLRDLGNIVQLSIHNWGNPINDVSKNELFDPFVRSSSAQSGSEKGWGLGLTLVQGVVEAHGGSIRVESSLEHGTTFIIDLPRSIEGPGLTIDTRHQSHNQTNNQIGNQANNMKRSMDDGEVHESKKSSS